MKDIPTILVVDDAENIRRSFSQTLELSGYHPVVADSGEAALEKIENEEIALTLMDVVMPGLGGIEAARRITAKDRNHPVILMSGYAESYLEKHGLPEGVHTFLKKPVEERILLREVEKGITARSGS